MRIRVLLDFLEELRDAAVESWVPPMIIAHMSPATLRGRFSRRRRPGDDKPASTNENRQKRKTTPPLSSNWGSQL
jgi:hypothetical protein